MKNILLDNVTIPASANFVQQGEGTPVIPIHGLAASLHDWDDLIPELTKNGYASFALDLLGHGESPRLAAPAYQMEWLSEHFMNWMRSLHLTEPAILIGHSLGGYLALEYARRAPVWTRGLILVNPFYSRSQLHQLLQRSYSNRNFRGAVAGQTPLWLFRAFVDLASVAMRRGKRGNGDNTLHSLPEHIRAQTALDYTRTAPGVYNLTNVASDMTEFLPHINIPTLVVWGDRDQTLEPASFPKLVAAMPHARGYSIHAGHVPHQSQVQEFNRQVLEFLKGL